MPQETSRIVPTPEQLRGVAHPTRMKMLGVLRADGPQTATSLAARLGLNSGATSYHLRQLAAHGFVVEAGELGTGRERWWRAAHRSTRIEDATIDGAGAFLQSAVVRHAQVLQESVEEFDELPDDWKRATTHSDWMIRLTAEQAQQLVRRISDMLTELQEQSAGNVDGTEQVMLQVHAFPRPGRIPHEGEAGA